MPRWCFDACPANATTGERYFGAAQNWPPRTPSQVRLRVLHQWTRTAHAIVADDLRHLVLELEYLLLLDLEIMRVRRRFDFCEQRDVVLLENLQLALENSLAGRR